MRKITVLVIVFAFQSVFATPSLQDALTAALEQAETDSAKSKVQVDIESDARVAAWHESDEKVVALETAHIVDIQEPTPANYVPGDGRNVQAIESKQSENSIKQELGDI